MDTNEKRELNERYDLLLSEGRKAEFSWCLQRMALRALCFPALKGINPRAFFKLIKTNVLIASARENITDASFAVCAAAEAREINNIGVKSDSSAAFAYRYAIDTSEVACDAVSALYSSSIIRATISRAAYVATADDNPQLTDSLHHDIDICEARSNLEVGLWSPEHSVYGKNLQSNFLKRLVDLGLGFIVGDVANLFRGLPSLARIQHYRLSLSDAIEQDPELIRRAIILGEDTEPSQNVRILLLGSGGAGKTQLAKRLKNEDYNGKVEPATLGVTIDSDEAVDLIAHLPRKRRSEYIGKESKLTTYLWDFGGQKLFHGLHSTFMHENAVYIVVVDSRHEQAVDYWLYQIQHLAGRNASVLIVTNVYEGCAGRQNETRLRRLFPGMVKEQSFHYFSCLDKIDSDFVSNLVTMCEDSRKRIFSTTAKVIEGLKTKYRNKRFLYQHEIDDIVKYVLHGEFQVDNSIHDQLKQLGKVIYLGGGSDVICLNPDWLIESAYTLINSQFLHKKDGLVTKSLIRQNKHQIFGENVISDDDIDQLVAYAMQVWQCTLVDNFYLFPDAAQSNEPDDPWLYTSSEDTLDIQFDLAYFPIGLHASLVSALHNMENLRVEPTTIWREGFVLNYIDAKNRKLQIATIEYDMRSGAVHVHTLHQDTRIVGSALRRIKSHLQDVMQNTANEKTVIPYIAFDGNYNTLDWEQLMLLLNKDGQKISLVVNNFNGDYMRDKNVTKIKKNTGVVNSQMGGEGNRQNFISNHVDPIDDEFKEIISQIVKEYLADTNQLTPDELRIVADVNAAIHNDNQKKLPLIWDALQSVTGFAANATTAAQFAIEQKGAILAALTLASTMFSV